MMFFKKSLISSLVLGAASALLFQSVPEAFAVFQLGDTMPIPEGLPNLLEGVPITPTDPDNPETAATQAVILVVGRILSRLLLFAATLAIVFLIVAGANFILAFGKDEGIEKGKRGMYWSVIGLVIIMMSYAIVQAVLQIIIQIDSSAS